MLTTVPTMDGLGGQDLQLKGHADVKAVTVTSINTSGTMYGRTIATASKAHVDQGSTTIGIGVSSVYSHQFTLFQNQIFNELTQEIKRQFILSQLL